MNKKCRCVLIASMTNLFFYQMSDLTLFLCFRNKVFNLTEGVIIQSASLTLQYKLISQRYRNSFI